MTNRLLVVADGASGALNPRAVAAPGLAQRAVSESNAEADILLVGQAKAPPGRWQRLLQCPSADAPGLAIALECLLETNDYAAVAIGDSALGRELAGRLGARLGLPIVGSAAGLRFAADGLEVTRPAANGRRTARVAVRRSPALVLVDPESAGAGAGAPVPLPDGERLDVPSAASPFASVGEERLGPWEMDITEADVIVAGGRGVGGPDGFDLLADLAAVLEGAVGASRVAVDLGWAPRSTQVGLTGKTVSPRLYIAAGISGAIHHTLGMRESSFIVAINTDAQAPILKLANASIVGDVRQVVPKLIAELKARRPIEAAVAVAGGGGA